MRSPIVQRILDETPDSVKRYVDLYADIIVLKAEIQRKHDVMLKITKYTDWELGRLDTLKMFLDNLEKIIK